VGKIVMEAAAKKPNFLIASELGGQILFR